MEKEIVIKVSTQSTPEYKEQRISINDISTYKKWENDEGKDMTGIVLKSGKLLVCVFSVEKLDELKKVIEL